MARPTVHVVGAGLAGLAAAVRLAGGSRDIRVYEAARQAGGRCRSYFDATLGLDIDNGNHLLLSGNHAALGFVRTLGSQDQLVGPPQADFPFVDLANGVRWRVRPNAGPIPWWVFFENRRVPGTRARDYLVLAKLLLAADRPIGEIMDCSGPLYHKLWHPFLLAALNTEPEIGSAALAGAIVRETLAKGGHASRPLVAANGLSKAFVDPALAYLAKHGATVALDRRLRGLQRHERRVTALDFADGPIAVGPQDAVVLAVPAPVAADLLPELAPPKTFRAIVNAHFKLVPPAGLPPILGVINGTVEWVFAFPDRLSITISGADRLLDVSREDLAQTLWADVAKATGFDKPLPPWQVIKERRATFAATPAENARRPDALAAGANLVLAGDWTATGLPATIEGAIRSGNRAADIVADATRKRV